MQTRDPGEPFGVSQALSFFNRPRLIKILVLAGLFVWLFHGPLFRLMGVWTKVPDWSHGWLIPAFCVGILLYIYDRWRHIPLRPTYLGLAVIALALALNILATWWWRAITIQDYSAWLVVVGMVIVLAGWRFAGAIWFPLVFFLFAVRLPGVFYNNISGTLQKIAAMCSTLALRLLRIHADLHGVVITVTRRSGEDTDLLVAEACSGMRILMAFAALGTLIAYTVRRPWWHRAVLVAAILPIAVMSNVIRVTGMGVLHYFGKDEWAKGFAHTLEGMFMLPVAFVLFWLLHKLLSGLFIDESHEPATSDSSAARPAGPAEATGSWMDDIKDFGARAAVLASQAGAQAARWLRSPRRFANDVGGFLRAAIPDLRQPHFLVLATVMLIVAASWQVVIFQTGSFFRKEVVPLKAALDRFPREVPVNADRSSSNAIVGAKWIAIHPPPPRDDKNQFNELIDAETESSLSARHPYRIRGDRGPDPDRPDDPFLLAQPQYIQRVYKMVDADGKDVPMREVYFFVSYYTGMPDAVPHVPDRCYLGGGWATAEVKDIDLHVPGLAFAVPVRYMLFGKGSNRTSVIYFLDSNGRLWNDHLKVRYHLNSPFGKYAYYSKIEIKFHRAETREEAIEWTRELLRDFLPILKRDFLPDWEKYQN